MPSLVITFILAIILAAVAYLVCVAVALPHVIAVIAALLGLVVPFLGGPYRRVP